MPKKYPPIPRVVHLPGNFVIRVYLLTSKQMVQAGLKDAYAGWEGEHGGGKIFIDNNLTYNERWSSFVHEMHHALTDWDHYIRETYITPFMIEMGINLDILEEKDND